jgi:hypothetical protein
MRVVNEHQIKLLSDLVSWGGAATSAELGGWSPFGARARTKSKRDGLVTFDGGRHGYLRITEAGRKALLPASTADEALAAMTTCPYWNGEKPLSRDDQ